MAGRNWPTGLEFDTCALRGHELTLYIILYCSLRSTYNVIKILTLQKVQMLTDAQMEKNYALRGVNFLNLKIRVNLLPLKGSTK